MYHQVFSTEFFFVVAAPHREESEDILHPKKAYQEMLARWPPLPQLALLLVMAGHPHLFEPQAKKGKAYPCSAAIIPTRERSLKRIFTILNFCPQIRKDVRQIEGEVARYLNLTEGALDSLCDAQEVQIEQDEMDADIL
jgi:hypothetical protein